MAGGRKGCPFITKRFPLALEQFQFSYEMLSSSLDLASEDAALLEAARAVTGQAYAPYSQFQVGAAARMQNDQVVLGSNQENASYPVGICAERVLLGNAATLFPGMPIDTLAISYAGQSGANDQPLSPCGMCRQSLLEFENRTQQPIRIILSGQSGPVLIMDTAAVLLPFAFTGKELKL